jgi:hypothetical protein
MTAENTGGPVVRRDEAALSLKIRVYTGGKAEPDKTVTIPLSVVGVAARLIPREAAAEMKKQGVDLDEIVRLSASSDVRGILLEAEDHLENQRVVISIE